MFNLFATRSSSDVQIAKSAKHLLTLMRRAISSRQAAIAAQGDEHHEIDLRLITRIEQVLKPLIGPSEGQERCLVSKHGLAWQWDPAPEVSADPFSGAFDFEASISASA